MDTDTDALYPYSDCKVYGRNHIRLWWTALEDCGIGGKDSRSHVPKKMMARSLTGKLAVSMVGLTSMGGFAIVEKVVSKGGGS